MIYRVGLITEKRAKMTKWLIQAPKFLALGPQQRLREESHPFIWSLQMKVKGISGGGEDDVPVGLLDAGQMSVGEVVEGSGMEMKEINAPCLLMWARMGRPPVWPFTYFHFCSPLPGGLARLLRNTGWILHCSLPTKLWAHFGCSFFPFLFFCIYSSLGQCCYSNSGSSSLTFTWRKLQEVSQKTWSHKHMIKWPFLTAWDENMSGGQPSWLTCPVKEDHTMPSKAPQSVIYDTGLWWGGQLQCTTPGLRNVFYSAVDIVLFW